MKSIMIFACILLSVISKSQTITFAQPNFKVGDQVKVTISGGLQGVDNDINNSSSVANDGEVSLGVPRVSGFYRVNFHFITGDKSYLLAILAADLSSDDNLNFALKDARNIAAPASLQTRMFNYFKQTSKANLLAASKAGLQAFCTKNAVSLVANAAFCLTTVLGGIEVLPICKNLSADNLEELGKEMTVAFFLDMKNKNFITQDEWNNLNGLMDEVDFAGVTESNCSLIFKSLQKLSDNEDIKIGLGFLEQKCKTTVLIIDTYKKVP